MDMRSRRRLGLLAILSLAFAYASLAQGIGWNQNAHYALVRALAHGTAIVDPYRRETGDVAWYHGHYYSTKAPGLALVTTPVYVALDRLGVLGLLGRLPGASSSTVGALWALGLVGCVLPALLILLLVRRLGDELEPGLGAAAAVAAGVGTLLLPFATLFFDHVLSAALGFSAFALLWLHRHPFAALAAGVLAGFAVTTEYPLALVAAALAVYSVVRGLRAALAYGTGALVGLVPLAAYNWWAFGSPLHVSYQDAVARGGISGHDVLGANAHGFYGVGWPRFRTAVELLFSHTGLVTLTPIVAIGAVGAVLLYRRGLRAEACVIGGLGVAFVVYNSGYVDPFGGWSPGPRFLVPVLPFLAVPLVLSYRRLPLTTTALAAASAFFMIAVTITGPVLAHDGRYLDRIRDGSFAGHGVLPVIPFLVLVSVAVVVATRATPLRPGRAEIPTAALATGGWALVALAGPRLLDEGAGVVALLAVAVAIAVLALTSFVPPAPRTRSATRP